ncbi:MAG: hypothetical protein AAF251_05680 [Pseudomonadota bacterium]
MDSFLFCLILVAMIALGGREQLQVAQLSDALTRREGGREGTRIRRPIPLLAVGLVCTVLTAGAMTYAALYLASIMPSRAAWMLVAFALALAALELFWPVKVMPAEEPTRSLGATGLVLLWRQFGDAARFVIFAFAVEAALPLAAFIGGALGGGVAVTMGWGMGAQALSKWPLRWIRTGLGGGMIVAAIFIGLNARFGGP